MKTQSLNTEKNDNPRFAFLPEMVLNHLNEAKPSETAEEYLTEPEIEVKKIIITADPEIPNLDSIPISENVIKRKKTKSLKNTKKPKLEIDSEETEENLITRFKNIINLNFKNQLK